MIMVQSGLSYLSSSSSVASEARALGGRRDGRRSPQLAELTSIRLDENGQPASPRGPISLARSLDVAVASAAPRVVSITMDTPSRVCDLGPPGESPKSSSAQQETACLLLWHLHTARQPESQLMKRQQDTNWRPSAT